MKGGKCDRTSSLFQIYLRPSALDHDVVDCGKCQGRLIVNLDTSCTCKPTQSPILGPMIVGR